MKYIAQSSASTTFVAFILGFMLISSRAFFSAPVFPVALMFDLLAYDVQSRLLILKSF
jgi:hypothetical protein